MPSKRDKKINADVLHRVLSHDERQQKAREVARYEAEQILTNTCIGPCNRLLWQGGRPTVSHYHGVWRNLEGRIEYICCSCMKTMYPTMPCTDVKEQKAQKERLHRYDELFDESVESRSVQRRKAIQRGEPMPTFDIPTPAGVPFPAPAGASTDKMEASCNDADDSSPAKKRRGGSRRRTPTESAPSSETTSLVTAPSVARAAGKTKRPSRSAPRADTSALLATLLTGSSAKPPATPSIPTRPKRLVF